MSKKDNENDLEDLQDWSEHQYDPGYWTGGNIPPHMKRGKFFKLCGFFCLLLGIFLMLPGLGSLFFDQSINIEEKIKFIILGLFLSALGYKVIKSNRW